MELEVPEAAAGGGDAKSETSPMPQGDTLDLDLIINRLLSYKGDPGKQVHGSYSVPIFIIYLTRVHTAVFYETN